MTTLTLRIPHRPISWNKFWSGKSWKARSSIKKKWTRYVKENVPDTLVPFDVPVHIIIHAYMNGRLPDPDNICSKVLLDPLIGRVLVDDTSTHVASVTTRVTRIPPSEAEYVDIYFVPYGTTNLTSLLE